MTYAEVKKLFLQMTGRYDIYAGTNTYIAIGDLFWEATKYMDKNYMHQDEYKWYRYDVGVGEYMLDLIDYVRVIKEVWAATSDGRVELTEKSLNWLMTEYADMVEDVSYGAPAYYCLGVYGMSPQQEDLTSSDYTDEFTYDGGIARFGEKYAKRGLYIYPPLDETYTIEVLAKFYSKALSDSDDENFWTVENPFALAVAAAMMMEMSYRNVAGQQQYKMQLDDLMKGGVMDMIEEEVLKVGQMEG